MQTSKAIYNKVNYNTISWSDDHHTFGCPVFHSFDGPVKHFLPMQSVHAMKMMDEQEESMKNAQAKLMDEQEESIKKVKAKLMGVQEVSIKMAKARVLKMQDQPTYTIHVTASWIGYFANAKEGQAAARRCSKMTATMFVDLCNMSDNGKIHEIIFYKVDMLSAHMIMSTDLRPFTNIKRVQFIECREMTLSRVATHLAEFRSTDKFEIIYYPEWTNLPVLKNDDIHAGVVSSLYQRRSNATAKRNLTNQPLYI